MSNYSKKIVYLSKAQYQELIANNSVTVNGVTVTYNENDIYVTPQVEPITDIKINNTSIGSNGVANIPVSSDNQLGVVRVNSNFGTAVNGYGELYTNAASETLIKQGTNTYRPIVPSVQDKAVFYGLAEASGDTSQSNSNNNIGIYTDNAKSSIQNMLGITDLLSTEESSTAIATHTVNSLFMMNGKLHRATSAIAIGDAVEVGTNCEIIKADEVFVKNTDVATSEKDGLVKINANFGICMRDAPNNDQLMINRASDSEIKASYGNYKPITPTNQHKSVFYALAKAAGDITQSSSENEIGTYTTEAKTAIRSMIGAENGDDLIKVQDTQPATTATKLWMLETAPTSVQVPTVAELEAGYVAKTDIATSSTAGIVKVNASNGITLDSNNVLKLNSAGSSTVKAATSTYPITCEHIHEAAFYGLAKAAGADEKNSTETVGTYTTTASAAIRNMIGAIGDVQINGTSVVNNGVANIPICSSDTFGVVKVDANSFGIKINENGRLYTDTPSLNEIKAGTQAYKPIVPATQHSAVFYGLAKAAEDTTQASSSNAVGIYTDNAKELIQKMIGLDGIFGTYETSTTASRAYSSGETFIMDGKRYKTKSQIAEGATFTVGTNCALEPINISLLTVTDAYYTEANIKAGTVSKLLKISDQHKSVFYGLAKAANDTTQASSANAVGTYTTEAKNAIQAMLGIEKGIELIETVTGTTPSITGQPNTTYQCGEVVTLNITPPANGTIDIFFTSGSTATTLTVPNTVKFPAWFDFTALETDTIYEIMITNGTYGSVMTWQS